MKLQAVTLATKLLVLSPAHLTLTQLAKYVFALARYDSNYDVRDRGRMLQQLLAGVVPSIGATDAKDVGGVVLRRAQVRIVLFKGKETAALDATHGDTRERLGTLGLVLGRDLPQARLLPDWLEHGVEPSLRDSPDDAAPPTSAVTAIGHVATASSRSGAGTGGHSTPVIVLTPGGSGGPSPSGSVPNKGAWMDLDEFYASESEEEDEEDEESEEDGEEEEGEEGEGGDGEESDDEEEASDHQSGDHEDHGGGQRRTPEEEEENSVVEEGGRSPMAPVR